MIYQFIRADTAFILAQLMELLQENKLPVSDLDETTHLFALLNNEQMVIGSGGLEFYNNNALLRSVAIKKEWQGEGLGKYIIGELEKIALSKGVNSLYLLTTTAKDFFLHLGYRVSERNDTPASILQSTEFVSLCPSTAVVMSKELIPGRTTEKKKLLFVCIENSNRSQMSQAFAKMIGGEKVEAFSAGSKPSGRINPKAIEAMKELGYDLSLHRSKSLDEVKAFAPFDAVVTMGCGDACPWMPAKKFFDWQIPDPKDMNREDFRIIRDLIGEKVTVLMADL